jgi:uncharacterized protein YijF (DUF1287 family)
VSRDLRILLLLTFLTAYFGCQNGSVASPETPATSVPPAASVPIDSPAVKAIVESALEQTKLTTNYSQDYFPITYPNGDPPMETGACTDVIIRAFRKAGVDLQKEVHEDMRANFDEYPKKWGLTNPDTNIDHRRVPNLQTFFTRKRKSLAVTNSPKNYQPGDVVTYDLDGKGMTHVGIVSNIRNPADSRFLLIHNIGAGTSAEDVLFNWKITGHFRYF